MPGSISHAVIIFLLEQIMLKKPFQKLGPDQGIHDVTEMVEEEQVTATNFSVAVEQTNEPSSDPVPIVQSSEVASEVSSEDNVKDTIERGAEAERISNGSVESPVPDGASRQATAAVDLSGNWTILVDDAFTSAYDEYLRKLGQPLLVRTLALTAIGSTREETLQSENGQKLFVRGKNVRGSWERTLETSEDKTSGRDGTQHVVDGHTLHPLITADGESVEVASWWEGGGKVHHSWVVGGKKYGGGDFENRRFLTDDGNILVCESIFHPTESDREKATVTWRFLRDGAIYGDRPLELPNLLDVLPLGGKRDDEKESTLPESAVVVGEILDSVVSSEEAKELSATTNVADVVSTSVEEAIEDASWVPPQGERWAIAAPGVDLSGKWKLIISDEFRSEYDNFLMSLGQPLIVRGPASMLVGNTREETRQSDKGRYLFIKGINARGIWERLLLASGSDNDTTFLPNKDGLYMHEWVPVRTTDGENVKAESYWVDGGTTHVSRVFGSKRYGGGTFESKRYLENNGDVYVCESTFIPDDNTRQHSYLKWRFLREGAALFVGSRADSD